MFVLVPLLHTHHHVAIHLHEAAIRVPGEAAIFCCSGEPLGRRVVEAQVENRVHHAGHRIARARADRNEQRVFGIAKFFPGFLLKPHHCLRQFARLVWRETLAVLIVIGADLRRDRKARRYRQADPRHRRQVRPFAAQQGLHIALAVAAALAEEVDDLAALDRCRRLRVRLRRGFRRSPCSSCRHDRLYPSKIAVFAESGPRDRAADLPGKCTENVIRWGVSVNEGEKWRRLYGRSASLIAFQGRRQANRC